MQLGTRWPVGGEVPGRVPAAVVSAVRDIESELTGTDTSQWRWTLTWLEGRPIVDLDDGTVIRYDDVSDVALVANRDDPEDDD
ncbi:hypothetical protein ABIB15_002808 [Marisediminicola sp. UYEF4]|uniref:hypothetical protein n=1 Tax=Marisediminicola sp. UYEF4 TaxID=1756384 RepID=UPI003393E2E9